MSTQFLVVSLVSSTLCSIDAQECFAAANTLTTACNDTCGAYEPCLVYNATECANSSSTSDVICTGDFDDACGYTCFQAFGAYNSNPTEFIFLVPYDAQDGGNDTIYASANNDVVTAVDQLALSAQTTTVWVQGGNNYQQTTKGKVVELYLADNLLTNQSQVTSVGLVSMDLSSRIYDIPTMVPSSINALSLSNTLLSEFPSLLESLGNLATLHLADNYISTVNASITWEKLTLLYDRCGCFFVPEWRIDVLPVCL